MTRDTLEKATTELYDRLTDHPNISEAEIRERLQELLDLGLSLDSARENVIRGYTTEHEHVTFDRTSSEYDFSTEAADVYDQLADTTDLSHKKVSEQLRKKVIDEGLDLASAKADLIEQTNRLQERRRSLEDES